MKKILFVAIMALISLGASAQEKTVIISNFSSRAVKVEMPLFYQMAVNEADGYALVFADGNNKMTGFVSVVSVYDTEENAQCIKIRIANGKDMTILSFFNGWADEVADRFSSAGYSVSSDEENVTIAKGDAKLVLNRADFAKAKITAVEAAGWQSF